MPEIRQICRVSGKPFVISEEDQAYCARLFVPLPTLCPEERRRRRFAHRNERHLYHRKCGLTGKEILSNFSPEGGYPVYDIEAWWTDQWDAKSYGRDFDFGRPFFEQFAELQKVVPQLALSVWNSENSPYCNYVGNVKDCYLVFGSVYSEKCYFGSPYYSRDCVDTLVVRECELCYECVDCRKLYECLYCQDCHGSNGLIYCYDLQGCSDCIGCAGLRNKKFCVLNKQLSEEEYKQFRKGLDFCDQKTLAHLKSELERLKLEIPHRYMQSRQVENVSGNYIFESKNAKDCYFADRCEDTAYCMQVVDLKDCYDNNFTEENELCYEYLGAYQNQRLHFSKFCNKVTESFYSFSCFQSKNLFGCIGMRRSEYCILNKPYQKAEYEDTVGRIIEHVKKTGEWGEFFPIQISPFRYEETVAQEYFPAKEEPVKLAPGQKSQIPDSIDEISDEILKQTLICEVSGKPYKIIPQELAFYRRIHLPIPRRSPDQRHKDRLAMRNSQVLWSRPCLKCQKMLQTPFAPERPEKVYCVACYLQTVY